jgi:hypothetical protein
LLKKFGDVEEVVMEKDLEQIMGGRYSLLTVDFSPVRNIRLGGYWKSFTSMSLPLVVEDDTLIPAFIGSWLIQSAGGVCLWSKQSKDTADSLFLS